MNFIAHYYFQGRQEYLSLVMDLKTIYEHSKALIYEENEYGYQRPLDTKHSNRIKKKVLLEEALFPTSIILGIDYNIAKDFIKEISIEKNENDRYSPSQLVYFNIQEDGSHDLFRIVDGQHRISGLSMAAAENDNLWNLPLNVTILLIPQNKRVIELNVFEDINSTAKKLKTDLVMLARQQYVLLGEENLGSKSEVESYLAIKTSFILNEELETSVWRNAIKFEKEINSELGIIGISAFTKAIMPLVRERVNEVYDYSIYELNNTARELAAYIDDAWKVIVSKWGNCFNTQHIIIDAEDFSYSYNNSYYLQKTTGVNAVTQILVQQGTISNFENLIMRSPLTEMDWIKGGMLAGLTSGSGFKKAVNLITHGDNQEDEIFNFFKSIK